MKEFEAVLLKYVILVSVLTEREKKCTFLVYSKKPA